MNDEANLKRSARRRLIGAVALTTAVVVLLPLLLDSEPKPTGQNIELRIPNKDKAGEFTPKINIPHPGSPAAAVPAPPPPVPASAPAVAAPAITAPAAASQVAAAPQAATTPHTAESKEPAKAKPAEQPASSPQHSFAIQVGAYSKTDSAQFMQKKLSKEGFKVYTEKPADKTRVRVGPFPTREAAEKTLRKLEALGLRPEIVTLPQ
ncbi:MAG: SPOR domain-containing protein [Gallionellaceae bacterium]|nr:SPOR domain-containing protein [Gallionellaceae bacterium]